MKPKPLWVRDLLIGIQRNIEVYANEDAFAGKVDICDRELVAERHVGRILRLARQC